MTDFDVGVNGYLVRTPLSPMVVAVLLQISAIQKHAFYTYCGTLLCKQ